MKLFLWGFMGSGKTTLQRKLGLPGFDFDEELYKRLGNPGESMGVFIERIGWEAFRKAEYDLVNECLEGKKEGLYSLGGGALLNESLPWKWPDGRDQILIWLNTDPEVCWERVRNDKNRPLVARGRQAFMELYLQRVTFYQKSHVEFESLISAEKYILDAIGRSL